MIIVKKLLLFILGLFGLNAVPSANAAPGSYYDAPKFSTTTGLSTSGHVGHIEFYDSTTTKKLVGVIGSTTGVDIGQVASTSTVVRKQFTLNTGATAYIYGKMFLNNGMEVQTMIAALNESTTSIVNTLSTGGIAGINASLAAIVLTTTSHATQLGNLHLSTASLTNRIVSLEASTAALNARLTTQELNAANTNYLTLANSTQTKTGGLTVSGTVTANKFVGDGSGITGIVAAGSGMNAKIGSSFVAFSSAVPAGHVEFLNQSSSWVIKVDLSTANTRLDNLDSSTATLTTALKSTAVAVTTAFNNVASATATLTTALNSTAATTTTALNNLNSSTATLTTAINSTAAATTTRLNNLDSSTATLTTRVGNLDSSTATLTTAINSTAAAVTTALNSVRMSTDALKLTANNTNYATVNSTETLSGTKTYVNLVIFSSAVHVGGAGLVWPDGSRSTSSISGIASVNAGSTNTWTGGQTFTLNLVQVTTSLVVLNGQIISQSTTSTNALVLRKLNASGNYILFDSTTTAAEHGVEVASHSAVIARLKYKTAVSGAGPGWAFESGGTERLFISSVTGFVGIGIAAPAAALHVTGGMVLTSSATVVNLYTTGDSGIGTTSPIGRLDVRGAAGNAGFQFYAATGTTGLFQILGSSASFFVPVTGTSATFTNVVTASGFIGDCSSCTRINPSNIMAGSLASTVRVSSNTAQAITAFELKSTNGITAGYVPTVNANGTFTYAQNSAIVTVPLPPSSTNYVNNSTAPLTSYTPEASVRVSTFVALSSATLIGPDGKGLILTQSLKATNRPTTGYFLIVATTTGQEYQLSYARPDCVDGRCDQQLLFQYLTRFTSTQHLIDIVFPDGSRQTTAAQNLSGANWTLNGATAAQTGNVAIGTNTAVAKLVVQSTTAQPVSEFRTYVSTSATSPIEFVTWKTIQGSTYTTNTTSQTVVSIPIPSSSTAFIEAKVAGMRLAGTQGADGDSATYNLRQGFRRVGGAAPVPIGTLAADVFETSNTWNADYSTTATGVNVIAVAGMGTMTAKWYANASYMTISTTTVIAAAGSVPGGSTLFGNESPGGQDVLFNPDLGVSGSASFTSAYSAVPTTGRFYGYTELSSNAKFMIYDSTGGMVCQSGSTALPGSAGWTSFTLNGCPSVTVGSAYYLAVIGDNFFHAFASGTGAWTTTLDSGGTFTNPANPGRVGAGDASYNAPYGIYVTN